MTLKLVDSLVRMPVSGDVSGTPLPKSSDVVANPDVDFKNPESLAVLVRGGNSENPSANTCKALETLMKVKGEEYQMELKEPWQRQIAEALKSMPEGVRDGARYAMTQFIRDNIPEAKV